MQASKIFAWSIIFFYSVQALFVKENLEFPSNLSLQRNKSFTYEIGSHPFSDSFYWDSTMKNPKGEEVKVPFCTVNQMTLDSEVVFKLPTPRKNQIFQNIASIEGPKMKWIFLSDLTSYNIITLTFTKADKVPNITEISLFSDDAPQPLPDKSDIRSHHLVALENETLLVAVNNLVRIIRVTKDEFTRLPWISLNITDLSSVVQYKQLIYVSSKNRIQIYAVSSSGLDFVRNISSTDFPASPTQFNIISMAVDQKSQVLYVMDFVHGIYLVDLSQDAKSPKRIIKMKTQLVLANMKRMVLSDIGVLLVELLDDKSLSSIYELAPESSDLFNTNFIILQKHEKLPNTAFISTRKQYGYVTFSNLILVFMLGVPSAPKNAIIGTTEQISHFNVQLALPYQFDRTTFLLSAAKNVFEIHELTISLPNIECKPSVDASLGTYQLESILWTHDCDTKRKSPNSTALSICEIRTTISLKVWDNLINSDKAGFIIGLLVTLVLVLIALLFCIYYHCKAEKYKKLYDLDVSRIEQKKIELEAFSKPKTKDA